MAQASAELSQITTFSSENRLMAHVVSMENLENCMVVPEWQWNDAAKALDPRYGSEGGLPTRGLIAQNVIEMHPDSVITNDIGSLRVSITALMQQDAVIATLVTDVGASTMATLAIRASYLEYACWVTWARRIALDAAACTSNCDAWQRTDHFWRHYNSCANGDGLNGYAMDSPFAVHQTSR